MKTLKIILFILNWIGAAVLYVTIISIAIYLINTEIIKLRYEWFNYIYYFGWGIISYYPIKYILNQSKEL